MSSVDFPIAESHMNELTSISGVKSSFYKIESPDFEQLTQGEIDSFYDGISRSLNGLDDTDFFKFYSWDGINYLNTNSERTHFMGLELKESIRPIETFFGSVDLFSDIGIYDDYLGFNGQYWRILSVKEFSKDEIDQNFLVFMSDYILSFKKNSNEKAVKGLEKIRNSHQANFLKRKRDVESEGAYSQAEELLTSLTHGIESIFEVELYCVVKALSLKELNQKTLEVIRDMKLKGVDLYIEGHSLKKLKTGLADILNDLIPGVLPRLSLRNHPDKTTHLRYLLPLRSSGLMADGIEFADVCNNPIYLKPFSKDIKNRNMLVSGASGGGKSVFVNKLIHSLVKDHPAVILDKDSSFKKVTLYHGGTVMEKSFNPLHFKDPAYLKEFVLSAVDFEKFDKKERGRLFSSIKAILNFYPEISDFREFLGILERDFEGISYYFEEIIDHFDTNDLDEKRVLYVDIENFPKEMISPLIIYVLEYFKNIAQSEKILVFDECWAFLKNHASYIDECFRTIRKKGAFLVAIAQGAKDFQNVSRELYNSITNNSFFKVYFPQEYIDDPNVDEFDNGRIKGLLFEKGLFSECYLKSQDSRIRKILRLYLTATELELFHTESGESEKLYNFIDEHLHYFNSFKEATDAFVRLRHAVH